VGLWEDRVLPRLIDRVMDTGQHRKIRGRVCADLAGEVVELGSGTGLNLTHVPPAVTRLWTVEPSERSRSRAASRAVETGVAIASAGIDARRLELDDASVDAVLSTWTLCTIPDPEVALAEVRRVLRPGGTFRFVEHGRSPDPGVSRWQDRLDGLQQRVAGGCHLTRPIDEMVVGAGFTLDRLDTYQAPGQPRPWGHTFEGVARAA
jgi:ubiquinone/menaquinone biosynthesis C-methylase UbiE